MYWEIFIISEVGRHNESDDVVNERKVWCRENERRLLSLLSEPWRVGKLSVLCVHCVMLGTICLKAWRPPQTRPRSLCSSESLSEVGAVWRRVSVSQSHHSAPLELVTDHVLSPAAHHCHLSQCWAAQVSSEQWSWSVISCECCWSDASEQVSSYLPGH